MGGDGTEDLRALYEAHVSDVYRYLHRRCRDRSLAEDLTQDVFVAVARSGVDPAELTIGWLIRTARNRLIDVARRAATGDRKLRLLPHPVASVDHAPATDARVLVERALEQLPTHHRIVLTLHHLDGLTVAEIATEIDRSVKGAEALLTRARAQLRVEIGDEEGVVNG